MIIEILDLHPWDEDIHPKVNMKTEAICKTLCKLS